MDIILLYRYYTIGPSKDDEGLLDSAPSLPAVAATDWLDLPESETWIN
jgi:hypothetical protein